MRKLNIQYKDLLIDLYKNGIHCSPRGIPCRELIGIMTRIDPRDNIVTLKEFETNLDYANEELKWYLSGSNKISFSKTIEKVWSKYSDDGISANSAYGQYMFSGRHQWGWCINKIASDPHTRQAVIVFNQPHHKDFPTKDFPCTMYVQLILRDDKLTWITNMRSNDIYLGFRNDVYCFAELQKKAANTLNVEVGEYIHFVGSMHLYKDTFKRVENAILKT